VIAILAILALATAAGVGGTAAVFAYGSSCDLDSLKSVDIGANTFVYAADGTLLGSIPAEKNREPVGAGDMSLWLRKATIAIEDRRFFEHGGVDHAAARAQPLHLPREDGSAEGQGGVSGLEARR
jgi:penicillin-binding protein 1A